MKILYDGQIYALQATGGINRYFSNLINRLPSSSFPTLISNHRSSKVNYPVHTNLEIIEYRRFRPAAISNTIEQAYFRSITALKAFDLIHPTYYSLLAERAFGDYHSPIVLTVHDLIHELFATQMDPRGEHVAAKRKAIAAAQIFICVSQNTKNDLLKWYAVPEERVFITPLASELNDTLAHGSEAVPARPYYLYVGSRNSHYKNFDGLLQAFSKVVSINSELALCVVGPPFNPIEQNLIAELNLTSHLEYYGYATDNHLAKLYRCSLGFVYPSLYEGFGIPPLEAMSCGTPVIAANSSSIPEVVSDAGLLFDPKSSADLADHLLFLAEHPAERERLIAKGHQRTQAFSWDKTAAQTLDIYQSLVN